MNFSYNELLTHTDLNLIHLDNYRTDDPTFDHAKNERKMKEEFYQKETQFTKTDVILSNRLVHVLSADK